MITRETILAANRYGLDNADNHDAGDYRTPVLAVACSLGRIGINLSNQPTVTGVRLGDMPDGGISHNYRDDVSERGLSLLRLSERDNVASAVWFSDRKKLVEVTGLLLPYCGSDSEPLILVYGIEDYDS